MRWIHDSMHRRLWIAFPSFLALILFILSNERGRLPDSRHHAASRSIRNKRRNGSPRRQMGVDVTDELESVSNRYYIYDDETISQTQRIQEGRRQEELEVAFDHVQTDMEGERNMLKALEKHPLRTLNPNEAEIFIIPTPITELLAYGCHWENCTWYDETFGALSEHPLFQQHQGHNHVLIAQSWPVFNRRYSAYMPALSRNYRMLENVTVANNFDPFGCMELNGRLSKDPNNHDDFISLYQEETPVTNAFSVGLGFHRPFTVRFASFDKFEASKLLLFYRTGMERFSYGSTKFTDMILADAVTESLPSSSIGHHIPRQEWLSDIYSSKFCLIVRTHAPHSYLLSNAVRAGCIPVIVSDDYQAYGGPFKSSISTNDFAVYIDEKALLADPVGELGKLQDLPEAFIKKKLRHLAIAQRVLLPDHPRPLFVEAFVREAIASRTNVLPQVAERLSVQVLQGDATISGTCFQYRYPSTLTASRPVSKDGEPIVITGVLSAAGNFTARHSIRETWASKHDRTVFFLVAGPWDDRLIDEFETYGDIFWIDMIPDDDSHSTYKVQAFVQAIDTHVDSYDYIMKTNDDTYVYLDDVQKHLREDSPDYWGQCRLENAQDRDTPRAADISAEMFPNYASGVGYVLSRQFTRCISKHLEKMDFVPFEDAATGILAEICDVPCSSIGWERPWSDRAFVYSGLKTAKEMVSEHWIVLKHHHMAEWSL